MRVASHLHETTCACACQNLGLNLLDFDVGCKHSASGCECERGLYVILISNTLVF